MPVDIGYAGVLERCRQYLLEELRDGPKLRALLLKSAVSQGYNETNLEMAARQLGIISDPIKVQGLGWRKQWRLPNPDEPGATVAPPPEPSRRAPVADEPAIPLAEQLARVQSTNALVDIFRYVDGEPGFLDSLPGNEITLRTIKRRFGGGRYSVQGAVFVIDGPARSDDGELLGQRPRGMNLPAAAAPAPSGAMDPMSLLMLMLKQQGDMVTALLSQRTATPASDPVAMFKAIDEAIARRTEAKGPPTPVDQALSLLREGMAMGRAEAADPDDQRFDRTINKVAPFLNALALRIGQPTPAPAGAPATAAALPPAPEDALPVTPLARVMSDLGPALPQLLEEAKKGTPPKSVAEYILDNASDEQYNALAAAAESAQFVDDIMQELARRVPQAGWAMAWLKSLAQALSELLAADRVDEQGDGSANGDGAGARDAGTGGGAPAHRGGR